MCRSSGRFLFNVRVEMKLSKLLLYSLSAVLVVSLASAGDGNTQEDCAEGEEGCGGVDEQPLIASLTDEDFQETIKAADMMVVVFYAPW